MMIEVTEKQKREIEVRFTKYEIARILGARALQVSMNAPILIKMSKEDLEQINFDPLKIAEIEFYAGVLPITVKRPLPKRGEEKAVKKTLFEKETLERKEEKIEEKIKEEKRVESKEKAPETERIADEESPEKKIIEEVKETEVMELAVPEDEVEEETATVEESE